LLSPLVFERASHFVVVTRFPRLYLPASFPFFPLPSFSFLVRKALRTHPPTGCFFFPQSRCDSPFPTPLPPYPVISLFTKPPTCGALFKPPSQNLSTSHCDLSCLPPFFFGSGGFPRRYSLKPFPCAPRQRLLFLSVAPPNAFPLLAFFKAFTFSRFFGFLFRPHLFSYGGSLLQETGPTLLFPTGRSPRPWRLFHGSLFESSEAAMQDPVFRISSLFFSSRRIPLIEIPALVRRGGSMRAFLFFVFHVVASFSP